LICGGPASYTEQLMFETMRVMMAGYRSDMTNAEFAQKIGEIAKQINKQMDANAAAEGAEIEKIKQSVLKDMEQSPKFKAQLVEAFTIIQAEFGTNLDVNLEWKLRDLAKKINADDGYNFSEYHISITVRDVVAEECDGVGD